MTTKLCEQLIAWKLSKTTSALHNPGDNVVIV